ncbi:hypothetical protein PFISCL1PPCAC_15193, partial [Pristionchus fissidentatus]
VLDPSLIYSMTIDPHPPVEKRMSIVQVKNSICSDTRGSFSHTHPVKQLLTTPVTQASKTRIGGQLFLCIIGTVIGISICIWLALFSHEQLWRRLLFASAAAFCSFIFILLGIKSLNAEPPEPEQLPDISQERRRSTITGRSLQKKSTAAIMNDEGPHEVLVVGDATRPLVSHH